MRYTLILTTVLLTACTLPPGEIDTEETVVLEETEEPEKPWSPEPRNLYLFPESVEPGPDTWVRHEEVPPDQKYHLRLNAYKLTMELHNRDHPEDPWILIHGGP